MNNYEHLVHQRCKVNGSGDQVWVLGLQYHLPTERFPEGRIWAHVDGDNIGRGAVIPADQLELA